jgi:hypothetical protein
MYQGEFMLSCNSNSNLRPGVILNENRFQAAFSDKEGVLATLVDPGSPSSGGNLNFLIKLHWTYFYPETSMWPTTVSESWNLWYEVIGEHNSVS